MTCGYFAVNQKHFLNGQRCVVCNLNINGLLGLEEKDRG